MSVIRLAIFVAVGLIGWWSIGGDSFRMMVAPKDKMVEKGVNDALRHIFNVRQFGAKGDGVADDTAAIQAAVDAASKGGCIYFPPGVYLVAVENPNGVVIKGRSHLKFLGEGGAVLKVPSKEGRSWMRFYDCSDIEICGLTFDKNGSTKFGGVAFYNAQRIRIHKNRFFDSDPKPSDGYDRYAIVFGIGAKVSEDLWISENLVEHLQVEIDKARRVHIVNNRSIKPEYTLAFGWASGTRSAICEDWVVQGNVVIDPIIYGIGIALDGLRDNSIIRNVLIANNLVIHRERIPRGRAIMVGSRPEEKVIAKGVVWENIAIVNNQVVYETQLPQPAQRPAIQVTASSDQELMSKIRISGNTIIGNGKLASWGIEVAYLTDSVISDNAIHGARNGILVRDGCTRNLITNNRFADIEGVCCKLERSGGHNQFVRNFFFGTIGTPYETTGIQPCDQVETETKRRER